MSLENRLSFEKVVSSISAHFVGDIDFDEAITSSIEDMGELSRASYILFYSLDKDKDIFKNTHKWHVEGVNSLKKSMQEISVKNFSWCLDQFDKFSFVLIRDVSKLPERAKAIKSILEGQTIKSFLAFPIKISNEVTGFISFSHVSKTVEWKGKDFALLRLFSELLGKALELNKTELELHLKEGLLRAIFESTAEGLLSVDENGKITHTNVRFNYMWRIPNEILNKGEAPALFDYVLNQLVDPDAFLSKIADLTNSSEIIFDMIFFKDHRVFDCYSCPLIFEGRINGRVWSFRDITESVHAEEMLRKSEKKYKNAYDRANFYKDLFTHDMNNILHNIKSSAELFSILKNHPEKSKDLDELNNIIERQCIRGAKLVNNVRKLSELETEEIILKPVIVYEVLSDAIQYLDKNSHKKNVKVKVDVPDKEFLVQANELLLDVFENILNNAIKYTDNPIVDIHVVVSKEQLNGERYIKLEFNDKGIGIADKQKSLIFKGGFRKDKNIRGLGLGLSLVKKIIESYNGQIWVENRVKGDYRKGSNFIVLIPEVK